MVIALIILTAVYLVIASLVALNSVFEAERNRLATRDVLIIALVSAIWPVAVCVLVPVLACLKLCPGKREFLSIAR